MRNAFVGTVALVACFLAGSASSTAAPLCSPPSEQLRQAAFHGLVDDINNQGLADFRDVPVADYHAVALSPVLRWGMRFLAAFGTDRPPNADLQAQARAFLGQFSSSQGREFATRIWVNDEGTSYDKSSANLTGSALCASTVQQHWAIGSDKDAPVDALMEKWLLVHHVVQPGQGGRSADQIVAAMNWARLTDDRSNHPFNALIALSQDLTFDVPIPMGADHVITLPYYSVGGIHGFRLESRHADMSLYLLYGNEQDIERLQKMLDLAQWKAITARFALTPVRATRLPLTMHEAYSFDPVAEYAFGVSLFSPALRAATEDVNLKVDNERLNFTAVSGLEGHIGNHFCCKISPAHLRIARIQPLQDVIFALVDGHTGAIVVIGSGIGVEP